MTQPTGAVADAAAPLPFATARRALLAPATGAGGATGADPTAPGPALRRFTAAYGERWALV